MEMGDKLYVVIPTSGRSTLLRRTLDSLSRCHLPECYAGTTVIENGTPVGVKRIVASVAHANPSLQLRYMQVKRANKSFALNEALARLDCGLIVFFDDDVRIDEGTLVAYALAAEARRSCSFFGGPVQVDYERAPPAWIVPYLPASARGYDLEDRGSMSGEYLGFNWAARIKDLKAAGLFDPSFGPGSPTGATGQESDMQRRLKALGITPVDVPGAMVWHYVPKSRCSTPWLLRRYYRMGVSASTTLSDAPEWFIGIKKLVRLMSGLSFHIVICNRDGIYARLFAIAHTVGSMRSNRTKKHLNQQ